MNRAPLVNSFYVHSPSPFHRTHINVLSWLLWILPDPLLHMASASLWMWLQYTNTVSCIKLICLHFYTQYQCFPHTSHLLLPVAACGIPWWAPALLLSTPTPLWRILSLASVPPLHTSLLRTSSHCALMDCRRILLEIGLQGHGVHAPLTWQSTTDALLSSCMNVHTHHKHSGFLLAVARPAF